MFQFDELEAGTEKWLSDCKKPKFNPIQLKHAGFLRRLENIASDLETAKSFADIFDVLQRNHCWSWFQFDVLKKIILFMSKPTDMIRKNLESYKESFKKYCLSRRLYECPTHLSKASRKLHRLLIVEFPRNISTHTTLQHLRKEFEMELKEILGIWDQDLILLNHQNSATVLIYSLPKDVANEVFPLSPEQEEMFTVLEVRKCYLYHEPTIQDQVITHYC
jgi:hypothetical protein